MENHDIKSQAAKRLKVICIKYKKTFMLHMQRIL